jgi:hypothetical protein
MGSNAWFCSFPLYAMQSRRLVHEQRELFAGNRDHSSVIFTLMLPITLVWFYGNDIIPLVIISCASVSAMTSKKVIF